MIEAYSAGASSQTKWPASMILRRLLGNRSSRNSAFATGTTRSCLPLMIVTGVVDLRQELGQHGQLLGVGADVAHRLDVAVAVVAGEVVGTNVVGYPARDRVDRRVDERAAGPSRGTCRGRGRAPTTGAAHRAGAEPRLRLRRRSGSAIRSGCAAAANSAAAVPTSGATMCGLPRSASTMSRARNSPIARGDRRSVATLGRAEPREVDCEQAGMLGKRRPHRRERVDALRPRTRQQHHRLLRATAVGVPDPQSVDRPELRLDRCGSAKQLMTCVLSGHGCEAVAGLFRASTALTLLRNAFTSRLLPTLPSTRPRNRPFAFFPRARPRSRSRWCRRRCA